MIIIYLLGLLSILTPCFFSIIPIYISILGKDGNKVLNTILFLSGLSLSLILLAVSFSTIASILNKDIFRIISGIYIFVMGLIQLEYINTKYFNNTKMIKIKNNYTNSYIYSLILGLTFSFGWIPCLTPTLSSILLSISQKNYTLLGGIIAILVYFLGLVTPFILASFYFEKFRKLNKYSKDIKDITGVILVFLGLMMIFNLVGIISF